LAAKLPNGSHYLILKGRAEQIPLRSGSGSLLIATPPYNGAPRIARQDCVTRDPLQYKRFLSRFLREATRVVRPGGFILLHTNIPPVARVRGAYRIVFTVYQKRRPRGRWTSCPVGSRRFLAQFARVRQIKWLALPVWLYRALVKQYSAPGDTVVHAFSGSGNGALAALELARRPVLLDLHHHRQVHKRLARMTKMRANGSGTRQQRLRRPSGWGPH
jgi:hypothetical protein